jgi:hypothetical protein
MDLIMKKKSLLMTALLVGFAMAVYSFAASTAPRQTDSEQANRFSYAQLTIQENDQVTWDAGGNDLPRVRQLNALYRDLGGNQRATVMNLLNAIGQQGWELVQTDQATWTFKQRN